MRRDVELPTTMLTKAAHKQPNLVWRRPKVDFLKAKIPLYTNEQKVWLESAMVRDSCLLEKGGGKYHANYTLYKINGW